MKFVYILSSTNTFGGGSKAFLSLLSGLTERGVEPIVVLPGKDGLYEVLLDLGIDVVYAPVRPNVYPKYGTLKELLLFIPRLLYWHILNVRSFSILTKYLEGQHVVLVHTNVSIMDIGYRLAKKLHVPHVFHIREYADKDFGLHYFPTKKHFHDMFVSAGCHTICITKDVQRYHGLDGVGSSSVIYDGVCPFSALTKPKIKKRYFFYAGRIQPGKGLLSLVRAYWKYANAVNCVDIVPLLVAGEVSDASYYGEIESFIKNNGMSENITLLGPRDDVYELMQDALAIVIPSVFEGFGFCMVEAMFNGCLVIGHNTGGTKEQFDNGRQMTGEEIGLRYDTEDDLAQCLSEVASHEPEYYSRTIEIAADVVSKLYSTESCSEKVFDLYNRILNAGNHKKSF